mgnify:CR=1 FL=1
MEIKINITKIKWDNQSIKPQWVKDIINKTYNDYDYLINDLQQVASWYNKPLSHFKIKFN